jgi:hypothetical protein
MGNDSTCFNPSQHITAGHVRSLRHSCTQARLAFPRWDGRARQVLLGCISCRVPCEGAGTRFFVGRHTYLDDGFNYLDLFIVIIGMLDFFPSDGSTGNLSALRSLRVMRPLKLVTKFQELKSCVLILLSSIPDLSNAVGLLVFIIVLFAILGVQLFGGVYRKACYSHEDGTRRDSPSPCGYIPCPDSFECLQLGENPGRGVISFDDIGPAIMTVTRLAIPPKSYYHTKLPFLYYFTTESCGGKNACRFLDL